MDKKNKNKIAILLVGEAATGKTSLIARYINNQFLQNSTSTIGIDYRTKKIKYKGAEIKLELWDSAGQEKYMAIPATFFSRADAIAVVFSLTQEYTFEKVEKWIENIFNYKSIENVTVAVLGNKKDLVDEITVTDDQIRKLCSDKDIKYFACSAKSGEGVNEVFEYFTEKVSERKNIVGSASEPAAAADNNGFELKTDKTQKGKKKGCCK